MDWGNDYFTFSDTNIEYIWKFLQIVHERGWLFQGHRATEWCPRCGTSISAHELAGSYIDQDDPSLFVRFPLLDRPGEALVIWTTTPWTLPANVAAAVQARPRLRPAAPTATGWPSARGAARRVRRDEARRRARRAGATRARSTRSTPAPRSTTGSSRGTRSRLEEGTGIVHIAPGCGAEDFELGKEHDLPCSCPSTSRAASTPSSAGSPAGPPEAADDIIADLRAREPPRRRRHDHAPLSRSAGAATRR